MNDQVITVEPFYSGNGPAGIDFNRNTGLDRHQGMMIIVMFIEIKT